MLAQSLLVAAGYPGILYLSQRGDRDDAAVIKFRLGVISFYTLAVLSLYWWAFPQTSNYFGVGLDILQVFQVLALTTVPFIPSVWAELPEELEALTATRNLLVGPITEEIIYRGVICGIYRASGASNAQIVLQTPLYFGIAHFHHGYEQVKAGVPASRATMVCLVQFAITLLFGMYSAFVWVRTGSVWPATAAHIFCNWGPRPMATRLRLERAL